jgi:hypothetical protein
MFSSLLLELSPKQIKSEVIICTIVKLSGKICLKQTNLMPKNHDNNSLFVKANRCIILAIATIRFVI